MQAPERLPLEATNLLIAGAIHFVVHLDSEMHDGHRVTRRSANGTECFSVDQQQFPSGSARQRFVSSIREVVDAEGVQVISNEIFRPGPDRRAMAESPLRPQTLGELCQFGYEPSNANLFGMRR